MGYSFAGDHQLSLAKSLNTLRWQADLPEETDAGLVSQLLIETAIDYVLSHPVRSREEVDAWNSHPTNS